MYIYMYVLRAFSQAEFSSGWLTCFMIHSPSEKCLFSRASAKFSSSYGCRERERERERGKERERERKRGREGGGREGERKRKREREGGGEVTTCKSNACYI